MKVTGFDRITIDANHMGGTPCIRGYAFLWRPLSRSSPKASRRRRLQVRTSRPDHSSESLHGASPRIGAPAKFIEAFEFKQVAGSTR